MAKSSSTNSGKPINLDLPNHEIVVLAAYLVGGQFKYVDTEDIAIKANEIAPGRFAWRKYKDQINIDTVRKRLWDAAKEERGALLIGSEKKGWLLTQSGTQFAENNLSKLTWIDLSKNRVSKTEQKWLTRERTRMMSDPAFQKFENGQIKKITAGEAERFFRIDDYVFGEARIKKIQLAKSAFRDDPELSEAIEKIAKLVREK